MEESSSRKKWIIIIIVALLLGAGVAGFFFMRSSSTQTATVSPTSAPIEQEPMPTEEPTVNKEDLKIKVLNGSGVVGEAGKVQKILEGADFVVESTANADKYDYKTTEIQAKSSVPSTVTDELAELLGEDYSVDSSSLDDSEEVDIVIIVGARKNAPSGNPKPTGSSETSVTTKPTTAATTPSAAVTTTVSPTKEP